MTLGADRHSFFSETVFTRRAFVRPSPFIRAMHPKAEILPDRHSVEKILKAGWVGQLKMHGHRAQLHVPSDSDAAVVAYNRQGRKHSKEISSPMLKEIHRLFRPKKDWNVIDAEWLKDEEKFFVFDFLKVEGEVLRRLTFPQRWSLLPRHFISPHVTVLPLLRDLNACLKALQSPEPRIEGLVFKSTSSVGFLDTSVVRCRRRK